MLVADRGDTYRIVAQTEHANQVGRMAEHWGNDAFDAPEPAVPTVAAAALHDNGWWDWDLYPHLGDGDPVNLFDVPPAQWSEFYSRGIDNAVEVDPYAGLLVSLHGAGVRRRRYGTRPSMPSYEDRYASFVDEQERRQRELVEVLRETDRYADRLGPDPEAFLASLHESGEAPDTEDPAPTFWTNYKLLQAWDVLSLYCCLDDFTPTTVAPVPMSDGRDVELSLTPVGETAVRLDPYPFDEAPLTLPVRARSIPAEEYATGADLVAAYYGADQRTVPFTFLRE